MSATGDVYAEIVDERAHQDAKHGANRDIPDGTGSDWQKEESRWIRRQCDRAFANGNGTYRHILNEEVCEAFAESDRQKLRAELVQVAAVAVAWIEKLDREHAAL